jgi:hypothetical protein
MNDIHRHLPGRPAWSAGPLAVQARGIVLSQISQFLAVALCLTSSAKAGTVNPGPGRAGWQRSPCWCWWLS